MQGQEHLQGHGGLQGRRQRLRRQERLPGQGRMQGRSRSRGYAADDLATLTRGGGSGRSVVLSTEPPALPPHWTPEEQASIRAAAHAAEIVRRVMSLATPEEPKSIWKQLFGSAALLG